jgi:predicted benzoate:H+ symporter BenE
MSASNPAPTAGYVFMVLALIASAVALFFGYYGAQLIYFAATFGGQSSPDQGASVVFGVLSYLSVVTAAALFPFLTLIAAATAWLCWEAARRRLNP